MMNKALGSCFVFCLLLTGFNQVAFSQQQSAEPLYYHGLTGHFDQSQTYANAGLIVDELADDSPFKKMESLETRKIRSLRRGERISSILDEQITSPQSFNLQINQSRHRHGRMYVSIRSSGRDTDGEMFLVQAQPIRKDGFRLGITAAAGPNGGSLVLDVPAGSPATKLWSST